MNVRALRHAVESGPKNYPSYSSYRAILEESAAPEHIATYTSGGSFIDYYVCACGWESRHYWDGADFAYDHWIEHVKDVSGITPKLCACGAEYIPIDDGKPCHELMPVED